MKHPLAIATNSVFCCNRTKFVSVSPKLKRILKAMILSLLIIEINKIFLVSRFYILLWPLKHLVAHATEHNALHAQGKCY